MTIVRDRSHGAREKFIGHRAQNGDHRECRGQRQGPTKPRTYRKHSVEPWPDQQQHGKDPTEAFRLGSWSRKKHQHRRSPRSTPHDLTMLRYLIGLVICLNRFGLNEDLLFQSGILGPHHPLPSDGAPEGGITTDLTNFLKGEGVGKYYCRVLQLACSETKWTATIRKI